MPSNNSPYDFMGLNLDANGNPKAPAAVEPAPRPSKNTINANTVAAQIQQQRKLIYCGGRFMEYLDGVYLKQHEETIQRWITDALGHSFTINRAREIMRRMAIDAFLEAKALNGTANLVNVANGLYDLDSHTLEKHCPDALSSIQLDVRFDPKAECPAWQKSLDQIFERNTEKIMLLQEFMGYCLRPDAKQEKALLNIGEGANGKSVILYVLRQILGPDNCSGVSLDKLGDCHYLAEMFGKLVNISTESASKFAVNDANFKAIVTGDTIHVDRKYGQPFQFAPFCRLIFAMNELPRVEDKSDAFFRRLLILRYNRQFDEDEQDKNLKHKLIKEKNGIFNWMLLGLKRLEKRGYFAIGSGVKAEIEEYRKENNNVLVFFEDKCQVLLGASLGKGIVYQEYVKFCGENGYRALSIKKFGKVLKKCYPRIVDGMVHGSKMWENFTWKTAVD